MWYKHMQRSYSTEVSHFVRKCHALRRWNLNCPGEKWVEF